MEQVTRIIIISTLILLQAIFGVPDFFYGSASLWLCSAAYSFFHANWFHLAVNSIAVWTIYKRCNPCRDLFIPFLIAMAVYPLALHPVIGFSNILYATLGLRTPSLHSRWWRQPAVITFLVITVLMLFIPQFSAVTHIAAFVIGVGCAVLHRSYLEFTKDARRYL